MLSARLTPNWIAATLALAPEVDSSAVRRAPDETMNRRVVPPETKCTRATTTTRCVSEKRRAPAVSVSPQATAGLIQKTRRALLPGTRLYL
jgi:hypothetical protein